MVVCGHDFGHSGADGAGRVGVVVLLADFAFVDGGRF